MIFYQKILLERPVVVVSCKTRKLKLLRSHRSVSRTFYIISFIEKHASKKDLVEYAFFSSKPFLYALSESEGILVREMDAQNTCKYSTQLLDVFRKCMSRK